MDGNNALFTAEAWAKYRTSMFVYDFEKKYYANINKTISGIGFVQDIFFKKESCDIKIKDVGIVPVSFLSNNQAVSLKYYLDGIVRFTKEVKDVIDSNDFKELEIVTVQHSNNNDKERTLIVDLKIIDEYPYSFPVSKLVGEMLKTKGYQVSYAGAGTCRLFVSKVHDSWKEPMPFWKRVKAIMNNA